MPLVLLLLAERPADVGREPYGGPDPAGPPPVRTGSAAGAAVAALRRAVSVPAFWLLAGGFAICGASTNGLIATHFVPAAHDHGMGTTTAAGLLALVGVFDVVGTIASGWLTDRVDSRVPLAWYYALRGLSLFALPFLFAAVPHATMLLFVVFYGLDWVATVPPTVALCRERFGSDGGIVFGGRPGPHDDRHVRRRLAGRGRALPRGGGPVAVGPGRPRAGREPRRDDRLHV